MGTADFACPSLEALAGRFNVVGVVTQPDRPAGRGHRLLAAPPVKKTAVNLGLPLLQVGRKEKERLAEWVESRRPDLAVVVAFGHILTPRFLSIPQKGTLNLHASLLPRFRGAAPIHRAIMAGERETGVTTMYVSEALDAGDVIYQESTPVGPDENVGAVHDRLAAVGADLLARTVTDVAAGRAPRRPQDEAGGTWAPPLGTADQVIRWDAPAATVHNQVRGLDPWPGALTTFRGKVLKVLRTSLARRDEAMAAAGGNPRPLGSGALVLDASGDPLALCGSDAVRLVEVQPAGGRRMSGAEFARGHRLTSGDELGLEAHVIMGQKHK